jgi:glyoxylate/hydroxypyruvate reductase
MMPVALPIVPFVHGLNNQEEAIWLTALRGATQELEIVSGREMSPDQADAAQVAIVANPNPADLARMPNLKWVHSLWAGVEKLMPALAGGELKVARLVDDVLTQTMAEAVLAWCLYLHRDMPRYRAQQYTQSWQQWPMMRARDRTIGVLGLGQLGSAAATRLAANDFKVLGWSRSSKIIEGVTTFCGDDGLPTVLNKADIVVALLPVTPETTALLDARRLSTMKQGASLINFARGAILDHHALVACLDSGALAHAVLDVFMQEPLPPDSPLWTHPKITILPHISAPTNKQSAALQVTGAIKAWYFDGKLPPFVEVGRGY